MRNRAVRFRLRIAKRTQYVRRTTVDDGHQSRPRQNCQDQVWRQALRFAGTPVNMVLCFYAE